MNNKTLDYYDTNAESFIENTIGVDFTTTQEHFLSYLGDDACILDFGCGSGRDTKYFLEQGYQVEAIDGSAALCKKASEYTGIAVKHMLFQELNEIQRYDGIWACSSILHLNKDELLPVLYKIKDALKPGGILYTSFKYGEFEGERNGRYFTNFTENSFREYIKPLEDLSENKLSIIETWITGDVRAGRGDERWLNLILKKG